YLAGDPDPLPAVHPGRGSARLDPALVRSVCRLSELKLRHTKDGVILPVRLTPKSARDEISGVEDFGGETVLKARVRALPEHGRANVALKRLVATWLEVPPSSVKVAQGGKSRTKQVLIEGGADRLAPLIDAKLAKLAERLRRSPRQSLRLPHAGPAPV